MTIPPPLQTKTMDVLVALSLFIAAAALLAAAGLRRVPEGSALTVHRFGRYRRTLGSGWRWLCPGLERAGALVELAGHHLHVPSESARGEAELYYQILEPALAGEALDRVDEWVAAQTREAIVQAGASAESFKQEINRRVGRLGLRVVRCALHSA